MQYCTAVTLMHGMPRLPHFKRNAISNPGPAFARLMPLIQMRVREPSLQAKKLIFGGDCYVEIHIRQGEVLKQIAEHPKGCREDPLMADERHAKFIDCAKLPKKN